MRVLVEEETCGHPFPVTHTPQPFPFKPSLFHPHPAFPSTPSLSIHTQPIPFTHTTAFPIHIQPSHSHPAFSIHTHHSLSHPHPAFPFTPSLSINTQPFPFTHTTAFPIHIQPFHPHPDFSSHTQPFQSHPPSIPSLPSHTHHSLSHSHPAFPSHTHTTAFPNYTHYSLSQSHTTPNTQPFPVTTPNTQPFPVTHHNKIPTKLATFFIFLFSFFFVQHVTSTYTAPTKE